MMPRPKLSNISITALQAEIQRRLANLGKLIAQRDELDSQIAQLQGTNTPDPAPAKSNRGRATGKTLAEYVQGALASGAKGIKDIEKAVLASGYPTKAKNIYNQVATVLGKPAFKRIEKGIYALKSAAQAGYSSARAAVNKAMEEPKAQPKPTSKPKAQPKPKGKRAKFAQTAQEFVLSLAKGNGATTAEINKAWKAAGRGATADTTLGEQVKAGKLKRTKLEGKKGSLYRLA